MKNNQYYGWKPDLPDARDFVFKPKVVAPVTLKSVDLRKTCVVPPIMDQEQLGSCTGNGISSVVYFDLLNKHGGKGITPFQPSRLFVYYNERVIEGTVNEDAGAEIRDGIKAVATKGVCPESEWKYIISKFKTKPPVKCYTHALQFKALKYSRIDNTNKSAIVAALLSGFPIVFGFTVYESFEGDQVAKTGVVQMPKKTEQVMGGHCVYMLGYDAVTDRFICANSWGTSWGNKGYFTIPAKYITNQNLADDFWVVNSLI